MHWLSNKVSVSKLQTWIGKECGTKRVFGPVEIYTSTTEGVTACFHVEGVYSNAPQKVVCKLLFSKLAQNAPNVYALLNRYCPKHTPKMLAWRRDSTGTWLLFEYFTTLKRPTVKSLLETLTHIQVTVSQIENSEIKGIPTLPLVTLPRMLQDAIRDAMLYGNPATGCINPRLPAWAGVTESELRAVSDFSLLDNLLPKVEVWSTELAGISFPMSLYHPDPDFYNAVETTDGSTLIFDWDEAILTNPVLSLGVMAVNGEPPRGDRSNFIVVSDVRDFYLNSLPWGDFTIRQRAYDLAVPLAPIIDLHRIVTHLREAGRYTDIPIYVAAWMLRNRGRWQLHAARRPSHRKVF